MKKSALLLLCCFILLIQLCSCSQNKDIDCEAHMDQKPYIATEHSEWNKDSVTNDYTILKECGNLDSIDEVIFQGPVLAQLILSGINKQKAPDKITYQYLIDVISVFKSNKKELYKALRDGTIARWEIERKLINVANFETFRTDLSTSGLSEAEIEKFRSFLKANNKSWTYKEAFEAFFKSLQAAHSYKPLEFPELGTLEKLLSDGKKANKNCLVYFSGWACVNARRFESQSLIDPEINQLITSNFIYAVANVDERQKLPGETKTIGEKHIELQKETFNSTSQPMLYILSPDGKILANWSYEDGTETFKSFLEKGIKE
jgi:hypothetical protein